MLPPCFYRAPRKPCNSRNLKSISLHKLRQTCSAAGHFGLPRCEFFDLLKYHEKRSGSYGLNDFGQDSKSFFSKNHLGTFCTLAFAVIHHITH
ncbi:MAG: hypothetical protein CR978_01950 [Gammaproteobacteria bacterium]|nr:MAG: hypothetical protein CR978_01950 [Gammaproteobacteria bacterium]